MGNQSGYISNGNIEPPTFWERIAKIIKDHTALCTSALCIIIIGALICVSINMLQMRTDNANMKKITLIAGCVPAATERGVGTDEIVLSNQEINRIGLHDSIHIKTEPASDRNRIYYKWTGCDDFEVVSAGSETDLIIPEAISDLEIVELEIKALFDDGKYQDGSESGKKSEIYRFEIIKPQYEKSYITTVYEKVVSQNTIIDIAANDYFLIQAKPAENVKEITYYKHNKALKEWTLNHSPESELQIIIDEDTDEILFNIMYDDELYLGDRKYFTNCATYEFNVIPCQVSMDVLLENSTMTNMKTYDVVGGETISVTAQSDKESIEFIGYYYKYEDGTQSDIQDIYSNHAEIVVPISNVGTKQILEIEAVGTYGNGKNNHLDQTGWQKYLLEYVEKEIKGEVGVNGKKEIVPNQMTTISSQNSITVNVFPQNSVVKTMWWWNIDGIDTEIQTKESSTLTFDLDNILPGTVCKLYVSAVYTDGFCQDGNREETAVPIVFEFEVVS